MGIKRIVDVSFWTDGKVDEFTPEDKYFMLYLLTNPFTKQLGIYEISVKQAAFQMGYSVEAFNALLDRFQNKYGMIAYSKNTSEIAILNYLRHSVMKGGKPVEDCIKQDIQRVKNKDLIMLVFDKVGKHDDLNATIKKVIDEYINENELYNDKNNDNDNDRTGNVSYHDSYHESLKPEKPVKQVKHKYGEYANVLLSDTELEKLTAEYPDINQRIERLSGYIASTGKKYKSHYATIRNWARKDQEQPKTRPIYTKPTAADQLNDAYNMMAAWSEGDTP